VSTDYNYRETLTNRFQSKYSKQIIRFTSNKLEHRVITLVMNFKELFGNYSQKGKVVVIGIRPKRLEPLIFIPQVMALKDIGLEGDRYKNPGGPRQVTLIQAEHLDSIASFLGKEKIDPSLTRRNIVVKGINLLSLKEKQFRIGDAVLEYSGECHPCSRMEENLGPGGYNAMRGHGGITAKVIEGGTIREGDDIIPILT
jgi:MOSC domain-containing protein YiiM